MAEGNKRLHFGVSTGLKRVLGRELITDDEVAIFELVKNSFDAGANSVHIHFGGDSIVVAVPAQTRKPIETYEVTATAL